MDVRHFPGPGTQKRGRWAQLAADGSVKTIKFPANSNITELVFFVKPVAGTAALTGDEYVIFVEDAGNDAIEAAMLTQAESLDADVQWTPIDVTQGQGPERVIFTNALKGGDAGGGRIGMKAVGGIALDVWVGGY